MTTSDHMPTDALISEMEASEVALLEELLARRKPDVAIEVGTAGGASLAIMAQYARIVHSIDIDPRVRARLGSRFPNVEFHTGPSQRILPDLIARLQSTGAALGFALVDGDHSSEGVRGDIQALLRHIPTVPFEILFHDSFNPGCREGIRSANWAANPHVHSVELDFHPGVLHDRADIRGQMWGGFARALLYPAPRTAALEFTASQEKRFLELRSLSVHARDEGRSIFSKLFRSRYS